MSYHYHLTPMKNEPLKIAKAIGNDILARPMYYIGGSFYAPAAKLSGLTIKQSMLINSSLMKVKIAGSSANYIHTNINPLH